jgi:hypothetical protein
MGKTYADDSIMNNQLKRAESFSVAAYYKALDDEERRQALISRFVGELLSGKPITSRVNLQRVQLSYPDVLDMMNDMYCSEKMDPEPGEIGLIRYHYEGADESLLDEYKANVSLAAFELIAKHYDSIIEEMHIDESV